MSVEDKIIFSGNNTRMYPFQSYLIHTTATDFDGMSRGIAIVNGSYADIHFYISIIRINSSNTSVYENVITLPLVFTDFPYYTLSFSPWQCFGRIERGAGSLKSSYIQSVQNGGLTIKTEDDIGTIGYIHDNGRVVPLESTAALEGDAFFFDIYNAEVTLY